MRDLVTRQHEDFFTHEFCDDQTLRLIRHHIGGIVLRPLGQMRFDLCKEPREILALACRDRHNTRKVVRLCIVRDDGQHLPARDAVHLVHSEQDRCMHACKLF